MPPGQDSLTVRVVEIMIRKLDAKSCYFSVDDWTSGNEIPGDHFDHSGAESYLHLLELITIHHPSPPSLTEPNWTERETRDTYTLRAAKDERAELDIKRSKAMKYDA